MKPLAQCCTYRRHNAVLIAGIALYSLQVKRYTHCRHNVMLTAGIVLYSSSIQHDANGLHNVMQAVNTLCGIINH